MNIHTKQNKRPTILRAKPHSFSVHAGFDKDGTEHTFEWRWPDGKPLWNRACKEDKAVDTYSVGSLREENVEKFLEEFGLQRYAKAPTFEVLSTMSPFELIKFRRERERDENLEYLEVKSTRGGDPVLAELAL